MASNLDLRTENPFFEKDGKKWCRYDSIEVEFVSKRKVEVRFGWKKQSIFFLNIEVGDVLRVKDIQGVSEVTVCSS